jgi:hypothetical protein
MARIITFVDSKGRYRVASVAYANLAEEYGLTEDDAINWVWTVIVQSGNYGITFDHPFHLVEDADQRARLAECCGNEFRYAGKPDASGVRSAVDGAWEMDTDGTPKVNMAKARGVHMDRIRVVRNAELVKKDLTSLRAIEAGDTGAQSTIATEKQVLRDIPATFDITTGVDTPEKLKAKWPTELPERE